MTSIETQRDAWNRWNRVREPGQDLDEVCSDQAVLIEKWLRGRTNLSILDAGCGSGWMCERLAKFGNVVGTDLADEVIARARDRFPGIEFVAGDFMELDFERKFDVVVSMEVLSHVKDQQAYIAKLASLLKPNGELMMATQNRRILEKCDLPPPDGWLRNWVTKEDLMRLLRPHFDVVQITTRTPAGRRGILRLTNSRKLNKIAYALFGETAVKRFKEHLFGGWTIMVHARTRK